MNSATDLLAKVALYLWVAWYLKHGACSKSALPDWEGINVSERGISVIRA